MKFKPDENLSPRAASILTEAGYEADTVLDEGLGGASDPGIFEVCVRERRCLVTLDLDFADVMRFPPQGTSGVAVLRTPRPITRTLLQILLRSLVSALAADTIEGRLWVVEPGRIRVYTDPEA